MKLDEVGNQPTRHDPLCVICMMPCAHGDAHTFDTNDANVHPCRCGLNKNKYSLVVHKSCHNQWTVVHRDSCVVCRTPTLAPQGSTADIPEIVVAGRLDGTTTVNDDARDSTATNATRFGYFNHFDNLPLLLRCCSEARR